MISLIDRAREVESYMEVRAKLPSTKVLRAREHLRIAGVSFRGFYEGCIDALLENDPLTVLVLERIRDHRERIKTTSIVGQSLSSSEISEIYEKIEESKDVLTDEDEELQWE
jgi:hypothetical protein